MIVVWLAVIEFFSWVLGGVGFKLASNNRKMLGMNKTKHLPIIDSLLLSRAGKPSNMQKKMVKTGITAARTLLEYKAVEHVIHVIIHKYKEVKT